MLNGGTFSNAPSGTNMVPSKSELISAVNHPTRRRILRVFVEEPDRCASASELAKAVEEPAARVGYHLKTLAHSGILRLNHVGEPKVAAKRHYGWSLEAEPTWLGLVLEIWPVSGDERAREDASAAARRRPPRGRPAR
jgi:DNA-binding transcriptional ArsR family regulator